jgi:DNA-binding MarR family transcriptional regulator
MYQKSKRQSNHSANKFINASISILSFSSHIDHFISGTLKPFSLTLPQFNVLCILEKHYPKPIVLKKLTEQMIDKKSNTSRLIDKLAEKNLAVRELVPDDKRIIHIAMTEEGQILIQQVMETLESNLSKRFAPHETNETAELIETLKILRG